MHCYSAEAPRQERGAALVIVLAIVLAFSLLAMVSLSTSESEKSIVGNRTRRTQALLAAEGGMARADFVFSMNPSLTDASALLSGMNADTVIGSTHFRLAMDSTLPRRRVIALGFSQNGTAGIQVDYEHGPNRKNIWSNAVFMGHGNNGRAIQGNLRSHGSVHVLGDGEPFVDGNGNGVWDFGETFTDVNHDGQYDEPIPPDSVALDLASAAGVVRNNYTGLHPLFAPKMPALPVVTYAGESVQTLHAELRVQNGRVALGGVGDVGQSNTTGGTPAVKETLDGSYVSDGYTGFEPTGAVHSDNGHELAYDMTGAQPEMPDLDAPYTDPYGNDYASYMDFLQSHALVIEDSLRIDLGTAIPLMSSGHGSLSVDAAGNVNGSGIIYVRGNITVADGPGDFRYDGRFTLVAEGDIILDEDLYSKGQFATDDVVGIITPGTLQIGTITNDEPEITAAIFAQEEIRVLSSRAHLAGSVVSNTMILNQDTDIYAVPSLIENMPPGMPGATGQPAKSWRRLPRSWVELP